MFVAVDAAIAVDTAIAVSIEEEVPNGRVFVPSPTRIEDKHPPLHHLHCKHLLQLRCWINTLHHAPPTTAAKQVEHPLHLVGTVSCAPMTAVIGTQRGWRLEAKDMNAASHHPSPAVNQALRPQGFFLRRVGKEGGHTT
eukprot:scaffold37052_cov46-Cyclotella_meneghiniana.AAC.6